MFLAQRVEGVRAFHSSWPRVHIENRDAVNKGSAAVL